MFFSKVATFFLLALAVGAEKKIELQDIEEDNLRSEQKSGQDEDNDKSDGKQHSATESGYNSLDFMKSGLLRFFDSTQNAPIEHPQRYVHQYAVTEPPEKPPQYNRPQGHQQAMVGYLSNMPMQIYLVPQYYSGPTLPSRPQHAEFNRNSVQYSASPANTYEQNFAPPQPVTYLYEAQPTAVPTIATVHPMVGYQVPGLFYDPRAIPPTNNPNAYYANTDYTETNTIDDIVTRTPYVMSTEPQFPRHYDSRTPIRGQYKQHAGIPSLPHPNPLLLKSPAPHLAHLPRTLPGHRPYTKPVYQESNILPTSLAPRPYEGHTQFKRRPTSLLDSYIPSSVQVEYLKRGLAKDPSSLYDALSSGRLPHPIPRFVERGFLPNQMYPTAGGGVTFGHYKRNSKSEKFPHK